MELTNKTETMRDILLTNLKNSAKELNLWWDSPLINVLNSKELTLEWWHGARKLTIFITDGQIEYLVSEGKLGSKEKATLLWRQFVSLSNGLICK